jgi:hypothetical protein
MNQKPEREGRTEGVCASWGGGRFAGSGWDRGDWNERESDLRLVIADRQVAITWGEMYIETGISTMENETRSLADKNSFWIAGNGTLFKERNRRRGVDSEKNESGRTGAPLLS